MNVLSLLRSAVSMPPRELWLRTSRLALRKAREASRRRRDSLCPTYIHHLPFPVSTLETYFPAVSATRLAQRGPLIEELAGRAIRHEFDLLGSGWVKVSHGILCEGHGGHQYEMGKSVNVDGDGEWLRRAVTPANVAAAQTKWRLIGPNYEPIDWQLDFKSGYRWSELTWYRDIDYGVHPGVDVKVPWELARMQHLPQLAWAYALAASNERTHSPADAYRVEFRHQVLDFLATNPPRFGVNWSCTMDVAIRVANWLVSFDLFRAYEASFERDFTDHFLRGVYEHGLHIVQNLEWDPKVRANHYLADIIGLLFVAAYLPRTSETDSWLRFSVAELIQEVKLQFDDEGTNFEASTSYHRLSAEMVVYGTSLVLALSDHKLEALKDNRQALPRFHPGPRAAPIKFVSVPGSERSSPFPAWYFERLERMAEFTATVTRPDGTLVQIGDNDNGRFLKLWPSMRCPDTPSQNELDHRHLVSAINGLFDRSDLSEFAGEREVEATIIDRLTGDVQLSSRNATDTGDDSGFAMKATFGGQPGPRLIRYPAFGVYVFRTERFYLAFRCGPVGQNGNGGHAHNDQLSFELAVDGVPLIVDPGTYVYTPFPSQRNAFRSTRNHSTLSFGGREQIAFPDSPDLFSLRGQMTARVVRCDLSEIEGEHDGFGVVHRRMIRLGEQMIHGEDACAARGEKVISFLLAPDVEARESDGSKRLTLRLPGPAGRRLIMSSMGNGTDGGSWSVEETAYSSAYGERTPTRVCRLRSRAQLIRWRIVLSCP